MPLGQFIQVVGLPRSGTAFVSTMLNLNPECIAYHELVVDDLDWKETLKLAAVGRKFVADVSTYGFLPKAEIAGSVKIFIDIPWKLSHAKAEAAFGYEIKPGAYEQFSRDLLVWAEMHKPTRIQFSQLWNIESMRTIWFAAFGEDAAFPETKVELLLKMNVQRQNPKGVFSRDCMSGRMSELI